MDMQTQASVHMHSCLHEALYTAAACTQHIGSEFALPVGKQHFWAIHTLNVQHHNALDINAVRNKVHHYMLS